MSDKPSAPQYDHEHPHLEPHIKDGQLDHVYDHVKPHEIADGYCIVDDEGDDKGEVGGSEDEEVTA